MPLDRRTLLLTLLLPLGSALWPASAMARGGEGRGGDDGDDDDDGGGGGDDRGDDDDDDDDDSGEDGGGKDDSDDDEDKGSGAAPSRSGSSGNGPARDRLPPLKPGQYRITRKGRIEALSQGQFRRLLQDGAAGPGAQLVQVTPGRVTVTDSAGWREEFGRDRYRLFDPRGNLVTRRALTRKDTARLRTLLGG
ncbi:MAG: hypothetical protein JNN06_14610 [Gemmobacter sp.]|uniref:hypothetical protein n=1 Tax=Gemmobacter sp. TaxID=1898957 RepID=UPI001A597883|nr:hypothetical protein [Gemmobacter sp.]MBL8563504.1 hypothetical protein [Gemmobacter sp.]